jgi:MinD superfamily P-loop ATPase
MVPRVDVFRCDGCQICIQRCPPQIIGLVKEKAAILIDLCEECGICAEVCPQDAIHFRLPNKGVEAADPCYVTAREATPNSGNWKIGVPLGGDGKGGPKKGG